MTMYKLLQLYFDMASQGVEVNPTKLLYVLVHFRSKLGVEIKIKIPNRLWNKNTIISHIPYQDNLGCY